MARKARRFIMRENQIYIMPTTGGALFLAAIVVLILTASTYNNNLIFILAFFLFSVFVVSMLQTHYNMKGVRLKYIGSEETFEGDRMGMTLQIELKWPRVKRALLVRTRSKNFKTLKNQPEDLTAKDLTKPVRIEVEAWRRGIHPLPTMIIETQFPLGIFRSWKVFRPEAVLTVYPKPVDGAPLAPRAFDQGEQDMGMRKSPDGDFGEFKTYQPGESYHQIAWKHYARTGDLYTREHWGAEDRHYVIPCDPPGQDLERYLQWTCARIKHAVDENASFEMETPSSVIAPGRGPDHARACWGALALIPPDPVPTATSIFKRRGA